MFTGSDVNTDDTGCIATYDSEGMLNGNSTALEGNYSTTVTYDIETCGSVSNCTIETNVSGWEPEKIESIRDVSMTSRIFTYQNKAALNVRC